MSGLASPRDVAALLGRNAPSLRAVKTLAELEAARACFGEADTARRFLTSPHPMLGGRTPLQAALTEVGARQVD